MRLLPVWRRAAAQVHPRRHFGRDVDRRAAEPLEPLLARPAACGGAEVDELDAQLLLRHTEANVLGLDVAMRPAMRVEVGQCAAQLPEESPRLEPKAMGAVTVCGGGCNRS